MVLVISSVPSSHEFRYYNGTTVGFEKLLHPPSSTRFVHEIALGGTSKELQVLFRSILTSEKF